MSYSPYEHAYELIEVLSDAKGSLEQLLKMCADEPSGVESDARIAYWEVDQAIERLAMLTRRRPLF